MEHTETDRKSVPEHVTLWLRARRKIAAQILRARLGIQARYHRAKAQHRKLVQLALNEAEALAWATAFPHLVFPVLAEEKVRAVAHWEARQATLQRREPELSFAQ